MKKFNIYITLFFCVISANLMAQGTLLNEADNFYQKKYYKYAIDNYKLLLNTKHDSQELRRKLADSYEKLGKINDAEAALKPNLTAVNALPIDYYNYAQLQKKLGNYTESDSWMQKYASLVPTDSRSIAFLKTPDYLRKIKANSDCFSLKESNVKSDKSEIGGYKLADHAYVVISKDYYATENSLYKIYKGNLDADQKISKLKKQKATHSKFNDGSLVFSADGKSVYFTTNTESKRKVIKRNAQSVRNLKIIKAEIAANGKWSKFTELPFNSDEYSVGHPALSNDGKTLYFSSNMPGGKGGSDIYKVAILSDGSYGRPENLEKINTEGNELYPFIDKKGNLYFSSNGLLGLGGLDVFTAIVTPAGNLSTPINVGEPINSRYDDFAFNINEDKKGFVTSTRNGSDDLFVTNQLKEIMIGKMIQGTSYDKKNTILPNVEIQFKDKNGNVIGTTTSDENGNYSYLLEVDKDYAILSTKPKYFDEKLTVSTKVEEDVIRQDLHLDKDPGISILMAVKDKKTKEPIEGVSIKFLDNMTAQSTNFTTPTDGQVLRPIEGKKMDDRGSYNVQLTKEGYFPKTITYNVLFDKEGQYVIPNLQLDPIVKDLSQMVKIDKINFDLGKSAIRPDAAVELNKIVAIMNEYPDMVIELGAHTDCRGTAKANQALSEKRALASANYIKTKIINPNRIYGKGYGESKLLNDCGCEGTKVSTCSEEQHAENRRTEFKVIETGSDKVKVSNASPNSF